MLIKEHNRITFVLPTRGRTFRMVGVAGDFNDWNPGRTPMQPDQYGNWIATLELPPGEYQFRYCADGQWMNGPTPDGEAPPNRFGVRNCVLRVPMPPPAAKPPATLSDAVPKPTHSQSAAPAASESAQRERVLCDPSVPAEPVPTSRVPAEPGQPQPVIVEPVPSEPPVLMVAGPAALPASLPASATALAEDEPSSWQGPNASGALLVTERTTAELASVPVAGAEPTAPPGPIDAATPLRAMTQPSTAKPAVTEPATEPAELVLQPRPAGASKLPTPMTTSLNVADLHHPPVNTPVAHPGTGTGPLAITSRPHPSRATVAPALAFVFDDAENEPTQPVPSVPVVPVFPRRSGLAEPVIRKPTARAEIPSMPPIAGFEFADPEPAEPLALSARELMSVPPVAPATASVPRPTPEQTTSISVPASSMLATNVSVPSVPAPLMPSVASLPTTATTEARQHRTTVGGVSSVPVPPVMTTRRNSPTAPVIPAPAAAVSPPVRPARPIPAPPPPRPPRVSRPPSPWQN